MRKSVSNNRWDKFDEALSMFEPDFKFYRDQGIQECREPLDAFLALDANFATDDLSMLPQTLKSPSNPTEGL